MVASWCIFTSKWLYEVAYFFMENRNTYDNYKSTSLFAKRYIW